MVFGAGQFLLFGLSVPKSSLCYEAPCTSGVECYISRPTEKTLMLNFMLAVASLSVLLSLLDLVSSMKAMVRWRRNREMLMEELSKGEQSSMLTTTTVTEDNELSARRSSTHPLKDDKLAAGALPNIDEALHAKVNVSTNERSPDGRDGTHSHTPVSTPVPTHFVLHSHLRPPLSPRPDRGPPLNPRMTTPVGGRKQGQCPPGATSPSQHSDSSEAQDKRAWV